MDRQVDRQVGKQVNKDIMFLANEVRKNRGLYRGIIDGNLATPKDILLELVEMCEYRAVKEILSNVSNEKRQELYYDLHKVESDHRAVKLLELLREQTRKLEDTIYTIEELVTYCNNKQVGMYSAENVWKYTNSHTKDTIPFSMETFKTLVKDNQDLNTLMKYQCGYEVPFSTIGGNSTSMLDMCTVENVNLFKSITGSTTAFYDLYFNLIRSKLYSYMWVEPLVKVIREVGDDVVDVLGYLLFKNTVHDLTKVETGITVEESVRLLDKGVFILIKNNISECLQKLKSLDTSTKLQWLLKGVGLGNLFKRCNTKQLCDINAFVKQVIGDLEKGSAGYNTCMNIHMNILTYIEEIEGLIYLADRGCLLDTKPYTLETHCNPIWLKVLSVNVGYMLRHDMNISDRKELEEYNRILFGCEDIEWNKRRN